ncbi:MAG TPA: DUF6286 domain-containing protein [Acidimicrobiales bacterium]|nr:DUF6286 domain-containing protein [Acidimicrobiales bacterium]
MRTVTRLVSALLALALLVGGLLAALEIAAAGLGREDHLVVPWRDWRQDLLDTPWEDFTVRVVLAALLAVGVLLLFLLLARRRPTAVPLADRVAGSAADLDRGGLERFLAARVSRVDGVGGASVKVRGGKARVTAVTPARDTAPVESSLRGAADTALGELGLASSLPVRVSVSSRRES